MQSHDGGGHRDRHHGSSSVKRQHKPSSFRSVGDVIEQGNRECWPERPRTRYPNAKRKWRAILVSLMAWRHRPFSFPTWRMRHKWTDNMANGSIRCPWAHCDLIIGQWFWYCWIRCPCRWERRWRRWRLCKKKETSQKSRRFAMIHLGSPTSLPCNNPHSLRNGFIARSHSV